MIKIIVRKAFTCISFILTMALILTQLTGCWDRRELEERNSVLGVAIDVTEPAENGKPMYKLTLQIPIPIKIAGGPEGGAGGGGINAIRVMSSTGFSVGDAMSNIQKRLNQQLFLGHTRIIAVSETVAKQGVGVILDEFRRDPSLRRLLWFLVVDGEAGGLLNVDPKLEQIPAVFILTMIENGRKMGRIPDFNLGRYYIAESNATKQPALNYIQVGEEDISWQGIALFEEDRMVGRLNSKESWILLQMRKEAMGGDFLIYPDDSLKDEYIIIHPQKYKTKTKTKIKDGKVHAHYDIYIQADIIEERREGGITEENELEKLNRGVEKDFEQQARKVIDILQNELKTDSLNLGEHIKAYHYTEWKKMNWKDEFPKAEIKVSYRVELRRIGMKMR